MSMRSFVWVNSEPALIDQARRLFREYETELNVDLCFQSFEEELANLPGKYAPPQGALLLCLQNGTAVACGAIRPLQPGIAELKRMFVQPAARGTGLGKELALQLISQAQSLGYNAIRLDTLAHLTAALKLYETLGFQEIPAYYENPIPGVVYLERTC